MTSSPSTPPASRPSPSRPRGASWEELERVSGLTRAEMTAAAETYASQTR